MLFVNIPSSKYSVSSSSWKTVKWLKQLNGRAIEKNGKSRLVNKEVTSFVSKYFSYYALVIYTFEVMCYLLQCRIKIWVFFLSACHANWLQYTSSHSTEVALVPLGFFPLLDVLPAVSFQCQDFLKGIIKILNESFFLTDACLHLCWLTAVPYTQY